MRLDRSILVGSVLISSFAACSDRIPLVAQSGSPIQDAGLVSPFSDWDGAVPNGQSLNDPHQCVGACNDPAGPESPYHSIADVAASLEGRWILCSGGFSSPADTVGIEFDMAASNAYILVYDAAGNPTRGAANDDVLTVSLIDITDPHDTSGATHYQIKLAGGNTYMDYFPTYSSCPRKLHFMEGTTGREADFASEAAVPTPSCSLTGTWDLTTSDNGSKASFQFDDAGNFTGGAPGAALPAGETFGGKYSLSSSHVFGIASAFGMACGQTATYKATFSASCSLVNLDQTHDDCRDRLYLDLHQTLMRR